MVAKLKQLQQDAETIVQFLSNESQVQQLKQDKAYNLKFLQEVTLEISVFYPPPPLPPPPVFSTHATQCCSETHSPCEEITMVWCLVRKEGHRRIHEHILGAER